MCGGRRPRSPLLNHAASIVLMLIAVWFQPTSTEKCTKAISLLDKLSFISPNRDEWVTILRRLCGNNVLPADPTTDDILKSAHDVRPIT